MSKLNARIETGTSDANASVNIHVYCEHFFFGTLYIPREHAAEVLAILNHGTELVEALKVIFEGFDSGYFVRNTNEDDDPDWAIRSIPYVQALVKAQAALAKYEAEVPA